MTNTQLKNILLETQPNCPCCGCKMIVNIPPSMQHGISHAAVLITRNNRKELICYGCHRVFLKKKELARLPFLLRTKKKIDNACGIFSFFRFLKIRWNQFVYFKIRGGKPTTKMPSWL